MVRQAKPWFVRTIRERSEEPRHRELLDAAARVFADLGYERTTVAAITAEARVSRATLYVYFASKDEVFLALAARIRDDFLAAQLTELPADSPRAVLREAIRAVARAVETHGRLLRLIEQRAMLDPRVAGIFTEIRERPIRRFARFLDRESTAGRVALPAPAAVVAEALSTALTMGILVRLNASARVRTAFVGNMITIYETLIGIDGREGWPQLD
ncbi:MAG TPA: helix-turn-helix domain-containing protein [Pseudonocardiaceae bacterium]|jgi:AcrR family transcriptional regulator|nr:helix-turn-helix domain-containing protein [Pseudonocardiaceae bacterium]